MQQIPEITKKLNDLSDLLKTTAIYLDGCSSDQLELAVDSLRTATIQLNGAYYNLNDLFTNLKFNRNGK